MSLILQIVEQIDVCPFCRHAFQSSDTSQGYRYLIINDVEMDVRGLFLKCQLKQLFKSFFHVDFLINLFTFLRK